MIVNSKRGKTVSGDVRLAKLSGIQCCDAKNSNKKRDMRPRRPGAMESLVPKISKRTNISKKNELNVNTNGGRSTNVNEFCYSKFAQLQMPFRILTI